MALSSQTPLLSIDDVAATSARRWFVARTIPHREAFAEAQLRHQDFHTFLPRIERIVRHARRTRSVSMPLFPRYVFVALDLTRDQWRRVNSTLGVSSLIMASDRPVAVPRGIVEALASQYEDGRAGRPEHEFQMGEKVRLIAGPFTEQLGVIGRLDERGRVHVLLQMMGRVIPVATPSVDVARVA